MWLTNDQACVRQAAPIVLGTAADAARLFFPDFAERSGERLAVAHFDREGTLICVLWQPGLHDRIHVAMSDLLRDACMHRTHRILLAHNHPSGDPTPSVGDRHATRRMAELLRVLDIELVDHLVIARNGVASFRALGLL